MALNAEIKSRVLREYQRSPTDTGSPEVQVALLTTHIASLSDHFKIHEKDHHSRRGLIKMVNRRRFLLDYLKKTEIERYRQLIARLGLRH